MWKVLLVGVLCVLLGAHAQEDQPTVRIAQGTVVGSRFMYGDFEYLQFLGIPYAGSTAGAHRFKAPTAPPTFEEDFIADREDVRCIRAVENGFEGTEDCLIANIYAPATNPSGNLPVMVWIHGHEFQNGEEYALSSRALIQQEVIVVSLNYRESIFGFLCLGVEQAPGNAGLKDILAGLKWVQDNIAQFGGDPTSVTLFGHGSGAAAVDLITLSPQSQGLVHKAIAQSGTSTAPWAISYDPRINAISVAEKLGHIVRDDETLADVFERTSAGVLMAAIKELELTDNTLAFAPCIENPDLNDPLFTEPPYDIILNGSYNHIPYITGFVENEGTVRAYKALDGNWLEHMESSFNDFLQQDLEFPSENEMEIVAADIKAHYFQGRSVDMSSIGDFIRYHGDTMILISTIRNARLRASTSQAPVYLYQFSYEGALGAQFVGPLSVEGAAHGEDIGYLFDIGITTEPGNYDGVVRDILVQRWTNFAKTGLPTADIDPEVVWSPVTADTVNYLHILNDQTENADPNLEVALVDPHPTRISFWDDLYSQYYREVRAVWEVDARDDEDDEEGETVVEVDEVEGETDEEADDDGNDATRNASLLLSILLSSVLAITFTL